MHLLAAVAAAAALAAGTPPNPIQAENAQQGANPAVWFPPLFTPTSVEGYASELSVVPGESVHLHVSTVDGYRYRVELYRLGWYGGSGARLLQCLPDCGGDEAGRRFGPPLVDANGVLPAGLPVTDTLAIPAGATSGYYYPLLRVTSGGDDTGAIGFVPFIVRASAARRAAILVQVPVNTWQAYNPWGGKSLYPFNSSGLAPAQRVSF